MWYHYNRRHLNKGGNLLNLPDNFDELDLQRQIEAALNSIGKVVRSNYKPEKKTTSFQNQLREKDGTIDVDVGIEYLDDHAIIKVKKQDDTYLKEEKINDFDEFTEYMTKL